MKTTYGKKRNKSRNTHGPATDWWQLLQLVVCLVLFLVVFIGKEVWPSKVAETGEQLLNVIRANTDYRSAFADLGRTLSQEESVLGEIGQFCVSVFAKIPNQETELPGNAASESTQKSEPDDTDLNRLSGTDCYVAREEVEMGAAEYESEFQVGDIVQEVSCTGRELPEGYSAQWLFLGEMETVTPVQGKITSQYGYRDHPTLDRYAVHGGVDIAADSGTAVAAFATGTVEAVGNSEDFGLWMQMKHSNGVTTFYAHCSEICVEKGASVQAGQTVACVGSTGNSTGPHLHFEIRLNGVRLDPMYYIEPMRAV